MVLMGCGGAVHKAGSLPDGAESVAKPQQQFALPFPEPETNLDQPLTPDIVYSILVAEIAAQRNAPSLAYSHYLYGSSLSGDAYAAEQATLIAIQMPDLERSLVAVERWVSLTPNELKARAAAVTLYIQAEQLAPALEHLQALMGLSEAFGQNGFMTAVRVVGRANNQQLALQLMQRLAEQYPDDQQAHYAVALVAMAVGEHDIAEQEVRGLLDTYPDRTRIRILFSNILYSQGDATGAEQVLVQALEDDPDNRLLLTTYARLLMESKKLKLSYEQFRKIDRLTPEDHGVLYTLGILAIELQLLPDAREYFQQAIASGLGKNQGDAEYFIGRTHEAEGQLEEAISWYEKIINGDYLIAAQARIAALLVLSGDVDRARGLLQQRRVSMPQYAEDLFLVESEMLQGLRLHQEVMLLSTIALDKYPKNPGLLYVRALSAASLDRLDILEQDLGHLLSQDPDNADALNALGYTLADQTDRYQEALEYIQKAIALKPDSPAILDSMGWVQYRLGNNDEALRYLQQAMDALPDAEIAAHLGEVLWVMGDQDQARKVWHESLEQNPDSEYLLEVMERFIP